MSEPAISMELVRPPAIPVQADVVQLIDPTSGEVLNLADATTAQLAAYRDHVRDWETTARQAKKLVDGELIRRMDARNEHTLHEGGYKITAPASEEKVEYPDPRRLHELLMGLAADPEINLDPEAVDAAIEQVTVYKPKKSKLDGLKKRGGPVGDLIHACSVTSPVDRRVTVTPK